MIYKYIIYTFKVNIFYNLYIENNKIICFINYNLKIKIKVLIFIIFFYHSFSNVMINLSKSD